MLSIVRIKQSSGYMFHLAWLDIFIFLRSANDCWIAVALFLRFLNLLLKKSLIGNTYLYVRGYEIWIYQVTVQSIVYMGAFLDED